MRKRKLTMLAILSKVVAPPLLTPLFAFSVIIIIIIIIVAGREFATTP